MPSVPTSRPLCSRRSFVLALGGCSAATLGMLAFGCNRGRIAGAAGPSRGPLQVCRRTSQALGSAVTMTVLHADRARGDAALDAAFDELFRVERAMSLYRPESDLSRLNRTGAIENADPYLIEALRHSREMSEASDGAFDVTVQPLWTLYATAQKAGRLPGDAEIAPALRRVDWRGVEVSGRSIRLREPGMAVTLNGIAQGFAADRAADAIKRHGVVHALVNTGEFASIGQKDEGKPWTVGIQHPREADAFLGLAALSGRCLSTSGDYETTFTGDRSRNHIFEPRTGQSPTAFSSVTVLADTATVADALSTAIFVLGAEKGTRLANLFNADVLLVDKDGRQRATTGFPWARSSEAQS